jgi:hypothetical protein
MRVADIYQVSLTSDDDEVIVSILLPCKTSLHVYYDTGNPRCLFWGLPSAISVRQDDHELPDAVHQSMAFQSVQASSFLLQQLCESMLGKLAKDADR